MELVKRVNQKFNFSAPDIPAIGKADDRELISYDASSSSYRSDLGAQARIVIDDAMRYMDLDSGLLSFHVVAKTSANANITGTSTATLSTAGLPALVSRVTLSANGVILGDLDSYNILHTLENHTEPRGRKRCLQKTEYYYNPDVFKNDTDKAQTVGVTVHMPLKLGILMLNKAFPVGFITRGLTLDVYFGGIADAFSAVGTSTGQVGYLEITNVQYKVDLIKPSPDFHNNMIQWLDKGHGLSLPFSRTYHDIVMPSENATSVTASIATNFCQSLRHIVIVGRTASTMSSGDRYGAFSSLNIAEYQVKFGGNILPRQAPFKYGKTSQESLARMLASGKNIDTVVDTETGESPKNVDLWDASKGHFISVLLGTQEFGSGYDCRSIPDIKLTLTCASGSSFTQSDRFDIFYTCDEILTISKAQVQVENQWLEN